MLPSAPGFPEQSPAHQNGTMVSLRRNTNTTGKEKFKTADIFFTSPPMNLRFPHHQSLLSMDM